jgi:hypothetical protein
MPERSRSLPGQLRDVFGLPQDRFRPREAVLAQPPSDAPEALDDARVTEHSLLAFVPALLRATQTLSLELGWQRQSTESQRRREDPRVGQDAII